MTRLKLQEWEEIIDLDKELYIRRRDITAKEEITNNLIFAENARQLSKILNCDEKSIRKAALSRGSIIYKGYRFRLGITDEPWPKKEIPGDSKHHT